MFPLKSFRHFHDYDSLCCVYFNRKNFQNDNTQISFEVKEDVLLIVMAKESIGSRHFLTSLNSTLIVTLVASIDNLNLPVKVVVMNLNHSKFP